MIPSMIGLLVIGEAYLFSSVSCFINIPISNILFQSFLVLSTRRNSMYNVRLSLFFASMKIIVFFMRGIVVNKELLFMNICGLNNIVSISKDWNSRLKNRPIVLRLWKVSISIILESLYDLLVWRRVILDRKIY